MFLKTVLFYWKIISQFFYEQNLKASIDWNLFPVKITPPRLLLLLLIVGVSHNALEKGVTQFFFQPVKISIIFALQYYYSDFCQQSVQIFSPKYKHFCFEVRLFIDWLMLDYFFSFLTPKIALLSWRFLCELKNVILTWCERDICYKIGQKPSK